MAVSFARILARGITATTFIAVLFAGIPHGRAQEGPGVTANSVTIGGWEALSGVYALYGVPIRAGTEAYFGMTNDKGGVKGRKIDWIVEDSALDVQKTVLAARKLVSRDNVLAIVNPHGTAQSAATFTYVLDENKVPMFFPYGGNLDWYNPGRPNLFGILVAQEDQGRALGAWAIRDGHQNILIMHGAAAAFELVAKNVESGIRAEAPNAKIEYMPIKVGTTDYAPVALDVIGKKPDAIVSIQIQQEIVSLSRELRQQSSKIQIYTFAPNASQALLELGAESVEGLKSLSLTESPLADTPAVQEYRASLAKFAPNEKPEFASLWAFGMAKVFVAGLSKVEGPLNRESLVKAFYGLREYDSGIWPPVTFGPNHQLGVTTIRTLQVVQGKWKPLETTFDVGKK